MTQPSDSIAQWGSVLRWAFRAAFNCRFADWVDPSETTALGGFGV